MKKGLPLLIIGVVLISGLGAVASPTDDYKHRTITFSNPLISDHETYLSLDITGTNDHLIRPNHYTLPTYTETFTFPFGTIIQGVTVDTSDIRTITLSKPLEVVPNPVIIGTTPQETTVSPPLTTTTWYEYDVGTGIIDNQRQVIVKVQALPVQYNPNINQITIAKHMDINWDIGWQYWEMPLEMAFGFNIKMIDLSLDNKSGSGVGIDLGYILKLGLDKIFVSPYYGDLSIGISTQDMLNTRITWDTDSKHKDNIARNFKIGFSYSQPLPVFKSSLTLAYDLDTRYNGLEHVGLEYLFNNLFAVRIGSNGGYMTTGAGIYLWKLKVEYAFQSHDLGNTHRVGILFGL